MARVAARGSSHPRVAGFLTVAIWLAACGGAERTLVVHSSLPEDVTEAAEQAFEEEHPDADVRIVSEPPARTLERLRSGAGSFDVWWGAPGYVLQRAAEERLLAPHRPAWSVDPALEGDRGGAGTSDAGRPPRATDRWHPSLVSPFVIAFNRDSLSLSLAPRDWIDMFHFRFRGEIVLLDPSESEEMARYLGAMVVERLRDGEELVTAFDWLLRLDASVGAYVADAPDLLRRLRFGEARVTVLPRHVAEEARHGDAPWLHYRFPESGPPVLVRGIAVTAASEQPDLAGAFVDLTGTPAVVRAARLHTRWASAQAVAARAGAAGLPAGFELELPWTPRPIAADTLAAELNGWLRRWEAEVRGRGADLF